MHAKVELLQKENLDRCAQVNQMESIVTEKEAALIQSHDRLSQLQEDIQNMTADMGSDVDDEEDDNNTHLVRRCTLEHFEHSRVLHLNEALLSTRYSRRN